MPPLSRSALILVGSLACCAGCGKGDRGLFDETPAMDASVADQQAGDAHQAIPDQSNPQEEACANACQSEDARCVNGDLQHCSSGLDGCGQWTAPEPCPSDKAFCTNGACSFTCQKECTLGERRCDGSKAWQLCMQTPAGCEAWSAPSSCAPSEQCRSSDGECIVACGAGPCNCQPGDTQACADLGVCKSGHRNCEAGEFGACQWQTGPSPETCNGKDDDCNGATDEGLTAPACSNQLGVCKGSSRACKAGAGWANCLPGDYAAHAQALGATWQAVESACDGADNDCNGQVDEAAACCQPSCAGKPCGADNECGKACTSGTCPNANQSCGASGCVCQWTPCGNSCCASAEQCLQNKCCKPNCAGRVCGPDPTCASSCGTCGAGSTCTAQGQCESGPTWKTEDSTISTDLYGVWGTSKTNVWAVGLSGVILHLVSGQWTTVASGITVPLLGVAGATASNIWAVGGSGTTTHFDGSVWSTVPTPVTESLSAVWTYNNGGVYAVGDNGRVLNWTGSAWATCCYYSDNPYGSIWGRSGSDFLFGGYEKLYRVTANATYVHSFAWDAVTAIGGNATQTWIAVARTAGTEFQQLSGDYFKVQHTDVNSYSAMWMNSAGEMWAVGEAILHYDGSSWTQVQSNLPNYLHGLWADPSGEMFAVGKGGTILHYH